MTVPAKILIRPARRDDIDLLAALLSELFCIEADFCPDVSKQRAGLHHLLEQGDQAQVFVAELDDQVVGMCSAQLVISTAEGARSVWVEDVIVGKEYRGLGVGTCLLAGVEQWARQRSAVRMQLLADADNSTALDFYRQQNWQPTQLLTWRKQMYEN